MSKRLLSPQIDLDSLFDQLRVEPIAFSECLISPAWALAFSPIPTSGMHYVLQGEGELVLASGSSVQFGPQSLLITPQDATYRIQARSSPGERAGESGVVVVTMDLERPTLQRWRAGTGEPAVVIVCGHFRARQAGDRDLFSALKVPIVQPLGDSTIGSLMKSIHTELDEGNAGGRTMATAMLRQVLVMLLRRSLAEQQSWMGELNLVRDDQIMRAFQAMVQEPGAAHTVDSLAELACLSRSAFIKRFRAVIGQPPATMLRDLRLLAAAQHLRGDNSSIEKVARSVGYASPSSFSRAFTARFGASPISFQNTRGRLCKE